MLLLELTSLPPLSWSETHLDADSVVFTAIEGDAVVSFAIAPGSLFLFKNIQNTAGGPPSPPLVSVIFPRASSSRRDNSMAATE